MSWPDVLRIGEGAGIALGVFFVISAGRDLIVLLLRLVRHAAHPNLGQSQT